ncbi:hypothetical protein MUO14_13990 [Halobacillus shinanisalinarum]|uniref:Uncharacterized protein n=1 Tax=Halobacillus shinanisalinarum TaxID=2932258 RepID=A0ABY4GU32_9BACI|nr:hypothetical protein [Halobacillus shinanisalinarum]UOQ91661.1 hypothetical protein MUO14_13990 [Halobacillus shinanisalinarum]
MYVHNGHFGEGKLVDQDVQERLDQLGNATVQLTSQLYRRNVAIQQPSIPRQKLNQS